MTCENQVFVANVVVIIPPWKIVATNVISELTSANAKLKAIAKIPKYKRLCEKAPFFSNGHRGAQCT
jgi:hypothetical protein